ncbi:hypothetical protein [Burkholderia metallica]|uniref:hypothetical protein n=1 Tax=Burkholderia metallica TaxID=488729 RepID=UPI001A8CC40E|nr:hypothetical protein [Burkholderia metallica]
MDMPFSRLPCSCRHPETSRVLRIIAASSIGIEQSSASSSCHRAAREAEYKKPVEAGRAPRFHRLDDAPGSRSGP